jgi:hypothetical protein
VRPGSGNRDQQQANRQRQSRSQQDKGQEKDSATNSNEEKKSPQDPTGSEQVRNDRTTEGDFPPESTGDLRDKQGRGRWGRLPKTVIQRMYDNGRRKLPEKYRILLEDYFRKLPEQSPR